MTSAERRAVPLHGRFGLTVVLMRIAAEMQIVEA